jgi:hypothetical protein
MAVATGVKCDAHVRAGIATLDMAAECCCAAQLHCAHDTTLPGTQMAGIGDTPCVTEAAEHVRHFQLRM